MVAPAVSGGMRRRDAATSALAGGVLVVLLGLFPVVGPVVGGVVAGALRGRGRRAGLRVGALAGAVGFAPAAAVVAASFVVDFPAAVVVLLALAAYRLPVLAIEAAGWGQTGVALGLAVGGAVVVALAAAGGYVGGALGATGSGRSTERADGA